MLDPLFSGLSSIHSHVEERNDLPQERPGRGGVHYVTFPVDRFYFRSLHFREPNGILFESQQTALAYIQMSI